MDNLRNLLDSIRTLSAVEQGDLDLGLFNKHSLVFGQDATAVLVVPWQLADYGLSGKQAAEVWEAIWSDPESLAVWADYMEALRLKHDIPPPPKQAPERIVTEYNAAASRSTRHKPDNPITAVLKSLAGRRSLKR